MRFIKLISALFLAVALTACQGGGRSPGGTEGAGSGGDDRAASCILETEDYTLRVVRGEKRLEFTSPQELCGIAVIFDGEGKCTLCSGAQADTNGENAGDVPGVSIPLEDGRPWLDWLVAAYPEDHLSEDERSGGVPETFSLNGADFSIVDGSKCTITRDGLARSAVRADE